MPRIFLPPDQFEGNTARICDADHLHLTRVLRARVGEAVVLLDGTGKAFAAVITAIGKSETTARIEGPMAMPPEPPVAITVAQALGKGDKFEQVIQHGTEAGARAFVPVRAERCVGGVPDAKIADRLSRWRQIAKGASEQSGRSRLTDIAAPVNFSQLLRTVDSAGPLLLLHTDVGTISLRTVLNRFDAPPATLTIAVGPEGGWSPAEVSLAREANVPLVSLGPRILRTETAALVAISQILYHYHAD